MRDFSSGDINGDVNINDYSNQTHYKLLIHCDNEELGRRNTPNKSLTKGAQKEIEGNVQNSLRVRAVVIIYRGMVLD